MTPAPTRAVLTAAIAAGIFITTTGPTSAPAPVLAAYTTPITSTSPGGPAPADASNCPDSGGLACLGPLLNLFSHSLSGSTTGGNGASNPSGRTTSVTGGGEPGPNLLQQYVLDPLRALFNGGNYASADTTSTAANATSGSSGGNHVAVANTGATAANTDSGTHNVQNAYGSGPGQATNEIDGPSAVGNNQIAAAYGGTTTSPSQASNEVYTGSHNTQHAKSSTGGITDNQINGSNNTESATASNGGFATTLAAGDSSTETRGGNGNGNQVTSSADVGIADSYAVGDNNRTSSSSTGTFAIASSEAIGRNNLVTALASGANTTAVSGAGAAVHATQDNAGLSGQAPVSGNHVSSTAVGGGVAAAEALSNNNRVTARGLNGGVATAHAGAASDGGSPAVGDVGRSTVTATATGTASTATAAANNASTAQASATTGGQATSIANLGSTAQTTATGTGSATATATVANSVAIARAFGAGASASASATSTDPAGGATTIPGGHAFAYTSDDGKTSMQFC
jgi:hypothetical protein